MQHSDMIQMLDQKYAGDGAISCPNDGTKVTFGSGQLATTVTEHGKLGVHASGSYLVCGACGFKHPTAAI